jgi:secreted trypsin-like serine protease
VPLRPALYCRLAYGDAFGSQELCAGSKGKDSCQGDSGGPLFIRDFDSDTPRYILLGIVSNGYGCGFDGYPGIYTRTSSYKPWILTTIGA